MGAVMEWIVGLYLAWGAFKIFCVFGDSDITIKPMWMYTQKNPLIWSLCFAACVLFWPFVKIKQ